ncbi:MAG: oligoribonuclease [Myxococcales bacterium]|nr:oligoribonuclease [Myxococcales bacterium]
MLNRLAAPLVWIDMEMTGLDPRECTVLEIATVVTDAELEVLATGPHYVVHHDDEVLAAMSEWCIEHHGASGLTDAVRASTISLAQAEADTLEFLRQHTEEGLSMVCGNSVDLDRRFIQAHMPRLDAFLHWQIIDVTTIKELARRWYPDAEAPPKANTHRALDDILESIAELRYYRDHLFAPRDPQGGPRADR